MNRNTLRALASACALMPLTAPAADDLQALREEIAQLKKTYEARIAALEAKLKQVESQPAPAIQSSSPVTSGNAFNPQLSLILDGVYFRDNKKGASVEMFDMIDGINPSHGHEGHAHGQLERGFNLRETELVFSATVSPHFDAWAMMTVSDQGDVALEEAYFDTRSLPSGLTVRAGKFLSGIGYLNAQHPHQWDFVDQNLAYRTLLGKHGLSDTGLRLSWLPKTGSWYTQLGLEFLQGKEQTFATSGLATPTSREDGAPLAATSAGALVAQKAGPRLTTLYAKFGPDLGANHALQFGGWLAHARQHQEVHDHTLEDPTSFVQALEGKGRAWGLDAVWKYAAGGYGGQGDFKLVGEYLRLYKDLKIAFDEGGTQVGEKRDFVQDGLVLQGVYGFLPHWQAGLRYDATGLTKNEVRGPNGKLAEWNKSDRWTLALTKQIDHFSLFRLQFGRARLWNEGVEEKANQLYLQYQMSLGAHGAHSF